MPLKPLIPDPTPTDIDLEPYLVKRSNYPPQIAMGLAELSWKSDQQRENPNLFQVPFVTEIRQYPSGIRDYDAYRASALWQEIRSRVIASASGECACCQAKATQVHHRDYRLRVLAGEDDDPLVPLCNRCHRMVHYIGDERRLSWQENEQVLADLIDLKDSLAPETES